MQAVGTHGSTEPRGEAAWDQKCGLCVPHPEDSICTSREQTMDEEGNLWPHKKLKNGHGNHVADATLQDVGWLLQE